MLKPVVLLALVSSLVTSFAHAESAKCPMINGTYTMRKEINGEKRILGFVRSTRVSNGVFSYTVGKKDDFQVADGVAKPFFMGEREGRIRFSCDEGTLKQESWALDDSEKTAHLINLYVVLNPREILLKSNNSRLSGVYTKQE